MIALTNEQQAALKLMNQELMRTGSLQNVSLETAKAILERRKLARAHRV